MILKIVLVTILGIAQLSTTSATALGNVTYNIFLTSCNTVIVPIPIIGPQPTLPNLAYGKATQTLEYDWNCTAILNTTPLTPIITWSYYANGPQGCGNNSCCYNTSTSEFSFSTVLWSNVNGTTIGTQSGSVSSGTYCGASAIFTFTYTNINITQCQSDIGIVARFGPVSLTIINGLETLSCTGVIDQTYCPGLH